MSTTITLPVSANDAFRHGHIHTNSQPRFQKRSSIGSRLSPLSAPYPITRNQSDPFIQTNRDPPRSPLVHCFSMEDELEKERLHSQHQNHLHSSSQNYSPTRSPMHAHSHSLNHLHNHSHEHSTPPVKNLNLIPTPILSPDGFKSMGKRRRGLTNPTTNPPKPVMKRHVSRPTQFLLQTTESYSLLHGILADPESRRIFYFMILNLAFMVIQSTYGILTGSLGLISDSIHMFFDCVALLVGVCAAVMSKWPPSVKFPYGYGKIDTLAGLGNGIFLMLISVEIVYEAIERLFTGANISRTTELLIVSTAGLVVNIVGIFAFHGHHGHSHGHGHGHDHGHGNDHSHSVRSKRKASDDHSDRHINSAHAHHDHHHDHPEKSHGSASLLFSGVEKATAAIISPFKNGHAVSGHSHGSENMQGIYLHIMADALGSVSVVVSTLLIQLTGWNGFDPVASCLIAVLIFASTIPLVTSTTKILLLSLNSDVEYNLRDVLSGVSSIKGVVGYTVPKFWLEDIKKEPGHHHHHGHAHNHSDDHHHHHHHHEHEHDCNGTADTCVSNETTVLGVIHVIASQNSDLEEVKDRVQSYLQARKMDVVVQVEFEGENRCWCGGGSIKTG